MTGDAIGDLAATPAPTSVALSWTNPPECTSTAPECGYQVRHRRADSDEWSGWAAATSLTAHTVTGLDSETEYRFGVRRRQGGSTLAAWRIAATTGMAANQDPEFPGPTTTRSVAENTAAGENVGAAVTATDPDNGDTLTYSLSGTDAASFDFDTSTGQITTKAALDFETKASYMVTVSVHDGKNAAGDTDTTVDDSIEVTINVTNATEVSVAATQTVGVVVFGSNFSSSYATGDGGGLYPGDTHEAVVSGDGWEASATLSAQFCAMPESGNLSAIDGSTGCVDASPATFTANGSGKFTGVALTYTVPQAGVPEHGVAVRVSGNDTGGDAAAAVVAALHGAARIDVTVKEVVRRGITSTQPASEDLSTLTPGDTVKFTAKGSGWIVVAVADHVPHSLKAQATPTGCGISMAATTSTSVTPAAWWARCSAPSPSQRANGPRTSPTTVPVRRYRALRDRGVGGGPGPHPGQGGHCGVPQTRHRVAVAVIV